MPTRPATHKPSHYRTPQQFDRLRNPAKSAVYDWAWRKLRNAHIAQHPLCVECMNEGMIVAATDVDHIKPVRLAPDRRLDETNLQSLCHAHHSSKTWRETLGNTNGRQ